MAWQHSSIDRLLTSACSDGGWGYESGHAASAEPTALACLALATENHAGDALGRGLDWLARTQQNDGAVAVAPHVSLSCWPTSLAILAWLKAPSPHGISLADRIRRAVDWLLHTEGRTLASDSAVYGHNTLLKGWPWVAGTHSWVEPTAYAILALRAASAGNHSRVREAVELLLNRAIPNGGWNYGNRSMFNNTLRPFPAQTGIALAALSAQATNDSIQTAIHYLQFELERVRTPFSLGWGIIGLTAWDQRPSSADIWLTECAARLDGKPIHPVFDSVLLLAGAERCPLTTREEGANHG